VALFKRRRDPTIGDGDEASTFIPTRARRRGFESLLMRVVATGGIVGIGAALAAILGSQDVDAWIIGLVVSAVTVLLAAVLWSSRTL
jgi:hypothetical protein